MKILDFIGGPNPRRLRLFLAEKGIEIEFEESDSSSQASRAADYFGHTMPFFRDRIEQIPAFANSSKRNALTQLGMLGRRLADRPFVAGDQFSIADITAFVAINLGVPTVYDIGAEFKGLERWYTEVAARPAFRAVFSN